MKPITLNAWSLALLIPVGILACGLIAANSSDATPSVESSVKPSIEGSYILEYRMLPDGTKVVAPDLIGMMTFTETHRNFNVYWTANGKVSSISIISKYTLTDKEYTEDSIYYASDLDSKGIAYEVTPSHGSTAVTSSGGKTLMKFPLHGEPTCEFDAHSFTATKDGVFVDHWKKIK
ncbi:MAG: hypothetical protein EXS10_10340 [Phycisphaerales bacterium]|nr:hypothetical protein [Phycisphaerales bacterium]